MSVTTVSTLNGLYDALSNAVPGQTILLEGGDYGELWLSGKAGFDIDFPGGVTIASADPNDPASFSGVDIRGASNMTFDGITFDYTYKTGDYNFSRPFNIIDVENFTVTDSTFDGDVPNDLSPSINGYGYAIGLSVKDSKNVDISNNEFFEFYRGAIFTEVDNLSVNKNDVHSIRSDGFDFAQVTNVEIKENYIHDFKAPSDVSDHRDMIQFWTNGTDAPSTNVEISGNHFDIGTGSYTQTIFMRNDLVDRGLAGDEMFYQNITITNNVIVNGHSHGITVGETDGLTITHNTVLHADGNAPDGDDAAVEIPRINVIDASRNVTITDNVTGGFVGYEGQAGWSVGNNVIAQDQNASSAGYYGDLFVNSSLVAVDGQHNFIAVADGPLAIAGIGADPTLRQTTTAAVEAQFDVIKLDGNDTIRIFDAASTLSRFEELPEGTRYIWNFGDGTTCEGPKVEHVYASGGTYPATLQIVLPSGEVDAAEVVVKVAGPEVLSLGKGGVFLANSFGAETEALSVGAAGVQLLDQGVVASVDRTHIARVLEADEFSIAMTIAARTAGDGGEITRVHGSFIISMEANGDISARVFSSEGQHITLRSEDLNLNDLGAHTIEITFSDSKLDLYVDGALVDTAAMDGTLNSTGNHGLIFGNPWNKDNFQGSVTALDITAHSSDYNAKPTTTTVIDNGVVDTVVPGVPDVPVIAIEDMDTIGLVMNGVSARIERELISELPGADQFKLNMSIASDSIESNGEVFRLHGSMIVSVDTDGTLVVRAFPSDGSLVVLTSENVVLNNGDLHKIEISLEDGQLGLQVNNNPLVTAAMSSPLGDQGNHDLVFGNPWARQNFEGDITSFEITTYDENAPIVNAVDMSMLEESNDTNNTFVTAPVVVFQVLGTHVEAEDDKPLVEPAKDDTIDQLHMVSETPLDSASYFS